MMSDPTLTMHAKGWMRLWAVLSLLALAACAFFALSEKNLSGSIFVDDRGNRTQSDLFEISFKPNHERFWQGHSRRSCVPFSVVEERKEDPKEVTVGVREFADVRCTSLERLAFHLFGGLVIAAAMFVAGVATAWIARGFRTSRNV